MKYLMQRVPELRHPSHPARGAWIEIPDKVPVAAPKQSHPARGAWIEIHTPPHTPFFPPVAPRKGCVD